jgi:hypothetical protein
MLEVILAITLLAGVAVGCIVTMNRGNTTIMNTMERTAVRTGINTQAELINYIHDNNADLWSAIVAGTIDTLSEMPADKCGISAQSFYIKDTDDTGNFGNLSIEQPASVNNNLTDGTNESGVAIAGNGIWITAVDGTGPNTLPYIDFYIRACWRPLGDNPVSSSVTITRIAK